MGETKTDNKLILDRAKAAVLAHDYMLAARLYKNLLKDDPTNENLLNDLGSLYQKSGRDADAIPIYKQIISESPDNVDALNHLGGIYRRLKKFDQSIDVLEKAIIADENNIQSFYNLGFTYKLMGNYEEALQCFNRVVEENQEDVLAYNHLGSIYALQNKHEDAVSSYQRGLKVDPNHPILHLNLAKSYEKLGRLDLAANEYEASLRSKPGWLEAIDSYADLMLSRNMTKNAADLVGQAIMLNPQNVKMHAKMGDVYTRQNGYDDAEAEYNTALKWDPDNKRVLSSLADVYDLHGKSKDAIHTMSHYEKLDPENKEMLKQYAKILLTADKLSAANKKINQILEENPDDIQALNLLGQYYICCGEDNKAESCFEQIKTADPDYTAYYRDSARRYSQKGNFKKAEEDLKKYLETNSEDAAAIAMLAEGYEKQNRIQEAYNAYEKLGSVDKDNRLYRERIGSVRSSLSALNGGKNALEADQGEVDLSVLGKGGDPDASVNEEEVVVMPEENPDMKVSDLDLSQADSQEFRHNDDFSFEKLTHNDETGASPFDKTLDDEILADRTENYMDLDDLVPDTPVFEEEDEESILKNNPFGASRGHEPRPSDDFESAFETEDIRSDEKPVSSMDVSDGMYEEEAPVEDGSSYGFDSQDAEPAPQASQEPLEEEVSESVPLQDESFEGQAESADGEFDPLAGLDVDESLDGEDNAFESDDQFETEPELDEELPQMEYEDLEFPADASIDDEIDIEPEEEPQVELPVEEEPQRFVPEPPAESASDFDFPEVEDITPQAETVEESSDGMETISADDFFNDDDDSPKVQIPMGDELGLDGIEGEGNGEAEIQEEPVIIPEPEPDAEDYEFPEIDEIADENSPETLKLPVDGDPDLEVAPLPADDMAEEEMAEDAMPEGDASVAGMTEDVPSDLDQALDAEVDVPLDETVLEEDSSVEDFAQPEIEQDDLNLVQQDLSLLNKTAKTLSDFVKILNDNEIAKKFKDTASMFRELKSLSEFLPEEEKERFLMSREHLQLEYIIKKLSGAAGLLSTADLWRKEIGIKNEDVRKEQNIVDMIEIVFTYMRGLISSLPDKQVATILDGEVSRILNKLK